MDKYFTWTPSRIEGVGLDVIAEEVQIRASPRVPDRQVNGGTRSGRPISMARRWRVSFVQSADDSQIANRLPHRQLQDFQGIRGW
jgi:hypothetical protein